MVLRGIFGLKREKVTGYWRKLQNEELHNIYSSPNIIRMIKSRGMRWACSTNGGDKECVYDLGGEARRKETARTTKT
jgi:acyl-coenzyme A synthetase/AMP-(fatty) acid ligase